MTVTAADLDTALSSVVSTLRPGTGKDWSVPAGRLEWDCWHTAQHLGDALMSYAAQIVIQPGDRFVCFAVNAYPTATPEQVLECADAGGRMLAATVRTATPQVRAFHPMGRSDPAGFAGMGCVELLVHGEDIALGLGLSLEPPRELCERVLARLFPAAARDLAGTDPWAALRWCTGRIELPGRPRLAEWRWSGAPPGE
jgi:uncharacterized protein (TIGR03083 family)